MVFVTVWLLLTIVPVLRLILEKTAKTVSDLSYICCVREPIGMKEIVPGIITVTFSFCVGVTITIMPVIIDSPQPITGQLYSPANLTCTAIGSPTPLIHWFKDGNLIKSTDPSLLVFNALTPNNRGFYHCEAVNIINGKKVSVNSSRVLLNITSKEQ